MSEQKIDVLSKMTALVKEVDEAIPGVEKWRKDRDGWKGKSGKWHFTAIEGDRGSLECVAMRGGTLVRLPPELKKKVKTAIDAAFKELSTDVFKVLR